MPVAESVEWEDLRFPATAINPPGSLVDPDYDTVKQGWLFASNRIEVLSILAQLPHGWAQGTPLRPHVHWEKTTSAAGLVLWQLSYQWSTIGEVREDAQILSSSTTTPGFDDNTADKQLITPLGDIDATGKHISAMLIMTLSRMGGEEGDTYGADARLLEFDIHYQQNSNGSLQEFTK